VKLTDFGTAKALSTLSSSTNTIDIVDIGTTPYRAPELFQVSNTRVCILEVLDMVNIVQD
jgi:serine/threonine protein kinase